MNQIEDTVEELDDPIRESVPNPDIQTEGGITSQIEETEDADEVLVDSTSFRDPLRHYQYTHDIPASEKMKGILEATDTAQEASTSTSLHTHHGTSDPLQQRDHLHTNDEMDEVIVNNDNAENSPSDSNHSGVRVPLIPPLPSPTDPLFNTGNDRERLSRRLFEIAFYIFLYTSVMLEAAFITREVTSHDSRLFDPVGWYPPMLVAIGCGCVTALTWYCFLRYRPGMAVKVPFLLSPLMTFAVGGLFVVIKLTSYHQAKKKLVWSLSLALGIVALVLAFIQVWYFFQVKPRLNYAANIVSTATADVPDRTLKLTFVALVIAILHSVFIGLSITGAAAVGSWWDMLAIFGFILSLLWVLQFVKNMLQTMIARVKYNTLAKDAPTPAGRAFLDTVVYLIGSTALGSAMMPVFTAVRVLVEGARSVFGGSHTLATTFLKYGNHYGLVYSGVHNSGFLQASRDALQQLVQSEMGELIEKDLTGSFCFLSGMTGGAASALLIEAWMLVIHHDHFTQLTLYALLSGYLICRIGTAWVLASVSAYYLAYADAPQIKQSDTIIHPQIQKLRGVQTPPAARQVEMTEQQP